MKQLYFICNLFLQDISIDIMETLCFSIKDVNANNALEIYTVSAICSPDIINDTQRVWHKAFNYIDTFFFGCKEIRTNVEEGM